MIKNTFLNNLLKCKNPDELIEAGSKSGLKKTLNVFDLIIIGIGAVVGTGIFTIIGSAIQGSSDSAGAGPAVVISMLLAALASVFSALSYSEISAMIPVAGSAYTYTYATMGEFMAWMVGWILMLEYAIGNITVASAWSGYFAQLLKGFKHVLPAWIVNCPLWLRNDYRTMYSMCDRFGWNVHDKMPFLHLPFNIEIPIALNIPAILIVFLLTVLLVKGVKESTKVASIMVGVNLFIITSFIIVGSHYVKPENWTPFMPNGFEGVFMGAFMIFFAYIGFDAISTAAEETKNPQRDLPIAILGTLVICTILYVSVALVLTGILPCNAIDTQAPLAHAINFIGRNWGSGAISFYAGLISVGALCALTSVLLIYQLGTTRILFAMSRDNFLPKSLNAVHEKFKTPHVMTWLSGLVVIICALFMDLNVSAELCNFGTFTSFIIICLIVLILRKTEPNRPRPFKVPLCPWFPILGIVTCGLLMWCKFASNSDSSKYFLFWLAIGLFIYAFYGYHNKRKYND